MRDPEPEAAWIAVPVFVTHRNCEVMHVLSYLLFGIIKYAILVLDNRYF